MVFAPFGMFNHTVFFIILIVLGFCVLGWFTGSFAVGLHGGFLAFIYIVIEQDITWLTNILYLAMVGLLFFTAFRMYDFSIGGNSGVDT